MEKRDFIKTALRMLGTAGTTGSAHAQQGKLLIIDTPRRKPWQE